MKTLAIIKLNKNLLYLLKEINKVNKDLIFKNINWLIGSILNILINSNIKKLDIEMFDILANEYINYLFINILEEEEHEKINNILFLLIKELYLHCCVYNNVLINKYKNVSWTTYGERAIITLYR